MIKPNLPAPAEFAEKLQTLLNTPLEQTNSYYLIWLINNKPVGHNVLKNILKNEIGEIHGNMWHPEYRAQGHGAKLFCISILEYYKLFNLKIILAEQRSSYPIPNKLFTKIGFKKWKTYISTASDLSFTCELNSYVLDMETASNFLKK